MTDTTSSQNQFPHRTCVSCGSKRTKQELIRITQDNDGDLIVNARRVASGRSAYLCQPTICLSDQDATRKIGKTLRRELTEQDQSTLQLFALDFVTTQSGRESL